MDLILSIPDKHQFEDPSFYQPFVREFANHYHNFSKRLKVDEICNCLHKFSKWRYPKSSLYNSILADIAYHFNTMRHEDHIRVIRSFANIQLKQTDLFDRVLLRVNRNMVSFTPYFNSLINHLYNVNYDSNLYRETIPTYIEKMRFNVHSRVLLIRTIMCIE